MSVCAARVALWVMDWRRFIAAAQAGRADHLSLWAGQGVAQVRPMPAAELVAVLAQELQAASA